MLSRREAALVAQNFGTALHDYKTLAAVLGEPFLRDGILCYFDGVSVEVVGISLNRQFGPAAERRSLNAVIAEWMRDPAVDFVNYFGPVAVSQGPNSDWEVVYAARARRWNRDFFVDLRSRLMTRPATRRALRRAAKNGVRVRVRRTSMLGHEHLRLLSDLARRDSFGISDVNYLANVTTILRSTAARLFEARVGKELVGFTVAHNHFPNTAIFSVGAFNNAYCGSDALYARMLHYYRDRGARELGLGFSIDRGLYRYKSKWGPVRIGPPCRQLIWGRRSRTEEFNDCLHWTWRALIRCWEAY